MENNPEKQVLTTPVKYVILDIVGFTRNRSIEAQSDIITTLNRIVRSCVERTEIDKEDFILLPTGDGICVALLSVENPYDIHIQIALCIVECIHKHNSETSEEMRKFQVRIGLNANVDNLIIDINGNKNVAGGGINFAQRVMSMADGGQILAGQSIYETLRQREPYMNSFRSYNAVVKHNIWLPVYQYVGGDHVGLNREEPSSFFKTEEKEPQLTKQVAYYFAHAIRNRDFFLKNIERPFGAYVTMALLWSLATDSTGNAEATEINPHRPRTWGTGKYSLADQFEYYLNQDPWLCLGYSKFIQDIHLNKYAKLFDADLGTSAYVFINNQGIEKLKKEWIGVWKDFEFDL